MIEKASSSQSTQEQCASQTRSTKSQLRTPIHLSPIIPTLAITKQPRCDLTHQTYFGQDALMSIKAIELGDAPLETAHADDIIRISSWERDYGLNFYSFNRDSDSIFSYSGKVGDTFSRCTVDTQRKTFTITQKRLLGGQQEIGDSLIYQLETNGNLALIESQSGIYSDTELQVGHYEKYSDAILQIRGYLDIKRDCSPACHETLYYEPTTECKPGYILQSVQHPEDSSSSFSRCIQHSLRESFRVCSPSLHDARSKSKMLFEAARTIGIGLVAAAILSGLVKWVGKKTTRRNIANKITKNRSLQAARQSQSKPIAAKPKLNPPSVNDKSPENRTSQPNRDTPTRAYPTYSRQATGSNYRAHPSFEKKKRSDNSPTSSDSSETNSKATDIKQDQEYQREYQAAKNLLNKLEREDIKLPNEVLVRFPWLNRVRYALGKETTHTYSLQKSCSTMFEATHGDQRQNPNIAQSEHEKLVIDLKNIASHFNLDHSAFDHQEKKLAKLLFMSVEKRDSTGSARHNKLTIPTIDFGQRPLLSPRHVKHPTASELKYVELNIKLLLHFSNQFLSGRISPDVS